MLTATHCIVGGTCVFQPNSILSYRGRKTVASLMRETPDFIGPDIRSQISPDLIPVDYNVWVVTQDNLSVGGS